MRNGYARQLMLFTLFTAMTMENKSRKMRQFQPVRKDKIIVLKTCPVCKTKHQEKNRFCSEECRLINKKEKKIRKAKRKNRKTKCR